MARALALGEAGEVECVGQYRDEDGKWKTHPTGKGKGVERWRARAYYRGQDGITKDVTRVAKRKPEAVAACTQAVAERLRVGTGTTTSTQPLTEAGAAWLALIARPDSGKSARTVEDYGNTYRRYIDVQGSAIRGLTLAQVNRPAIIRGWLQTVADAHGTGAATQAKTVLSGILGHALNDGVIDSNATKQVRPVKATASATGGTNRKAERDTDRALTEAERDAVIAYADARANDPGTIARSRAKRKAAADLTAFMAGTGVRITEARTLRWEHVHLNKAGNWAEIHGTKTGKAKRRVDLPGWLTTRLTAQRKATGGKGLVFPSPAGTDREQQWERANCAGAMAEILEGAGHAWATPHTYRRTVATILHSKGAPLARIADQLGHEDPSFTARVYLGQDFEGDKSDLAAML